MSGRRSWPPIDSAADLARALARNAEIRLPALSARTDGAKAATGSRAMSATRRGARCSFAFQGRNPARAPPGKWTDAATGEHGDLLDLIRLNRGLTSFRDAATEARAFLRLPHPPPAHSTERLASSPAGRIDAARRLFAMSMPIAGTRAEAYLRGRGIAALPGTAALRFHPGCYYRQADGTTLTLPALIAAVTDGEGRITGVHRTYLAPDGSGKARVAKSAPRHGGAARQRRAPRLRCPVRHRA